MGSPRKPGRTARSRRTREKDWKPAFLELLRDYGDVAASAKACGIGRRTAYDHKGKDAKFADAWDDALESLYDSIDAEFLRRGREGVLEPVFYQGAYQHASIRKYDTVALNSYANAHMKRRGYGRQDLRLQGDPDKPIHSIRIVTDRKRPAMKDGKA